MNLGSALYGGIDEYNENRKEFFENFGFQYLMLALGEYVVVNHLVWPWITQGAISEGDSVCSIIMDFLHAPSL